MPVGGFGIGQGVFNARQAHAGATGVSGIGGAIRDILDDARRKGLLAAQSQFQTQGAMALEKFKQANPRTRNLVREKADGTGVEVFGQMGEDDKFIKEGSGESDLIRVMRAVGFDVDGPGVIGDIEADTIEGRAARYLTENGQKATPANIQAVIDRGLVQ